MKRIFTFNNKNMLFKFKFYRNIISCLFIISMIFVGSSVYGAPRYAVANGNWNATTTWSTTSGGSSGASIPVSGDDVFIGESTTSRTVTIPSGYSANCTSLTIGTLADNTAGVLNFSSSTSTLTVSGNVTMNRPNAAATSTIGLATGTMTVNGNLDLAYHTASSTTNNRLNTITISTGTLTVNGNLIFDAEDATGLQSQIVFSSTGIMNLAGNFTLTNNLGTLSPSSGTVNFNGTGSQSIPYISNVKYNNLQVNKSSGTATLTNNTTTTGDIILSQGTLSTGAGNYNLTAGGDWTNNGGTFSGGTSTVTLTGASGIISGTNSTIFPNLIIDAGSAYTMNNSNTCNNLTFGISSGNNSLTHGTTSSLIVNGTVTINQPTSNNNTTAWNINAGSATVSGLITFAGTTNTTSRIGKITITTGTLNANGGITFVASNSASKVIDMSGGAGTLNLKGALTIPANSSTLTAGTSSIFNYYDDINTQTVNYFNSGGYNDLYLNNTSGSGAALSAAITSTNVNGNIFVNSGLLNTINFAITLGNSNKLTLASGASMNAGTSLITFGTTGTAIINGTLKTSNTAGFSGSTSTAIVSTNNPTITLGSGSTVEFSSGSAQTITGRSDYANVTISGASTKTLNAAANLSNTLTIGTGSTFDVSSSNFALNIKGDFIDNGSFSPRNGTVTLNGTGAQNINGSSATSFYNLTFNNSNGLTLGNNVTVSNILNMTAGNITTGSNTLTLGTSVSNLGTLSRTNGNIITGLTGGFTRWFAASTTSNVIFPVGTSGNLNQITLSFTVAPSTGGTLTAMFVASDPGTNSLSSIDDNGYTVDTYSPTGYWQINNSGITGGTYSVGLEGQGFNVGGTSIYNYPLLRILKRTSAGNDWVIEGSHSAGTGTNNDATAWRTGLSGFSQFTLGGNLPDNPFAGPLPVELASFTSSVKDRNVTLHWSTISEVNNSGFQIERYYLNSTQGTNNTWSALGFVKGKNNSHSTNNYNYSDDNLQSGKYKYRLKQVDYNGNFKYYELNNIIEIGLPARINLSQNYPNPFNPVTKIDYELPFDSKVSLKMYDLLGRVIKEVVNENQKAGFYTVQFNAGNLSSGIYFYRLIANTNGQNIILTKKMNLIK